MNRLEKIIAAILLTSFLGMGVVKNYVARPLIDPYSTQREQAVIKQFKDGELNRNEYEQRMKDEIQKSSNRFLTGYLGWHLQNNGE